MFKVKRRWIRFKIKSRRKINNIFKKGPLSNEQEKALKISKRLIVDEKSTLYAGGHVRTEVGERYFVENGHLFIRITYDKIRIINGKYKYDVTFGQESRDLNEVKKLFIKNMDRRLDKLEIEINKRVEKSLDHILTEGTTKEEE